MFAWHIHYNMVRPWKFHDYWYHDVVLLWSSCSRWSNLVFNQSGSHPANGIQSETGLGLYRPGLVRLNMFRHVYTTITIKWLLRMTEKRLASVPHASQPPASQSPCRSTPGRSTHDLWPIGWHVQTYSDMFRHVSRRWTITPVNYHAGKASRR